jgi:alkylation response protein AidB-like acyl-CoA dehydrogenase
MTGQTQMDPEVLLMVLDTLSRLEKEKLTLEAKLEMDHTADFPMQLIRFMVGPEVGLHLVFIPEEHGGLGAGAQDIALLSEKMARMDMAVATSFLAICLGLDPIRVGATAEQQEKYIRRIADEGLIVAYAVTEPEAGSNVQSLKTRAERVLGPDGGIQGYRLNGQKQFVTNGAVADLYTILADTPNGPSFFIVEAGTPGLMPGKHEDKHGIRASDTSPLSLEDLYVPAENLVGGVEGLGLKQANQVFGYTRLMVAAFGLGAGMASLERAVAYSRERVQFGTPLAEKQGYTHKLIVPHAVRLEAARAYIEKTAERLDSGEEDLGTEGAIAKYFATEAGDAAANDGIQAFGGYGYVREYEVEKIKRDVKITTIYEGTSEILQNVIGMFRLRELVRSKGRCYEELAEGLDQLPESCGARIVAEALRLMSRVTLAARDGKLTRFQHVLFMIADMMTWCETGEALCRKVGSGRALAGKSAGYSGAVARLFAREVVEKVYINALRIAYGSPNKLQELLPELDCVKLGVAISGRLDDMDLVSKELSAE